MNTYLCGLCRRLFTGPCGRALLFGLGERRPRLGGLRERDGEALLGGLGEGLRCRLGGLLAGGGLERRLGGGDRVRCFLAGLGVGLRGCSFSGLVDGEVDGLGGCSWGVGERDGLRGCSLLEGEGLGVGLEDLFFLDADFLGCEESEGVWGPFLLPRGFLSGLRDPAGGDRRDLYRGLVVRRFRICDAGEPDGVCGPLLRGEPGGVWGPFEVLTLGGVGGGGIAANGFHFGATELSSRFSSDCPAASASSASRFGGDVTRSDGLYLSSDLAGEGGLGKEY